MTAGDGTRSRQVDVAGESLHSLLRRGALPLHRALHLGTQMADALAEAHAAGLVHGGLRPDAVTVMPDGRVTIRSYATGGDLAEGREGEKFSATSSGLSPEQATGELPDYRSDQFAFGLVLYEMVCGREAFARATLEDTRAAVRDEDAPPLPAGVPAPVRWLVSRCLAKEPAERYASTRDLAQDLRDLDLSANDLTAGPKGSGAGVRGRIRRRAGSAAILVLSIAALAVLGLCWRALYVEESLLDLASYRAIPLVSSPKSSSEPVWSPDGRSIAFVGVGPEGAQPGIWVQGIEAAVPVRISPEAFGVALLSPRILGWSGDSRMLYCVGSTEQGFGIYRLPVVGGDPVLVHRDAYGGTISPDGRVLITYSGSGSSDGRCRLWYAAPPDSPRRLYQPAPFASGTVEPPTMAFSPDGKRLLVNDGGEIWLLPWPPGKGERLRRLENGGLVAPLSWMPDSRHVISGSDMVDIETGGRWPIGARPVPSLDGTRMAYTVSTAQSDVIELPLDGGPPRTLLGSRMNEEMPALSANGMRLVFCRGGGGISEIWSMSLNDGSARPLITSRDLPEGVGDGFMNPALSGDGKRLAFVAWPKVFVALLAGGAPVRATDRNFPGGAECSPTWSPGGDRLAYIRQGLPMRVEVVRPGGTDPPRRIWEGEAYIPPAWSPTGEWIAIAPDAARVVLVSPDGRVKREFRSATGPLAWAPDGRTLYVIHRDISPTWVGGINVRTGVERIVLSDLGDLRPGGPALDWRVSVTPSGRSLVYSVVAGGSDIWMLSGVKPPRPWYARLWPW